MTLSVVEKPGNKAHIRINSGIYVATDVPLDVAQEMVRRYNTHDELVTALDRCLRHISDFTPEVAVCEPFVGFRKLLKANQ